MIKPISIAIATIALGTSLEPPSMAIPLTKCASCLAIRLNLFADCYTTLLFTTVAAVQADTQQASGNQPSFTPPAFDYDSIVDQPHDVDYWQEIATNAVVVGDSPTHWQPLTKP